MREIQGDAGSTGEDKIDSGNRDFDDIAEWGNNQPAIDQRAVNQAKNLIRLANQKFPLSKVLYQYLPDIKNYETTGWFLIHCPFPEHNDSTPSCSVNLQIGRFKCFGCEKGGGSVQFLSYFLRRSPSDIAKEILTRLGNETAPQEESEDFSKISEILVQHSEKIHKKYQEFTNNPKQIEKLEIITRQLDIYLSFWVSRGLITAEKLQNLTTSLEEYLELVK